MTDRQTNDPLTDDLRAYLSQVAAEPMAGDLPDRVVAAAVIRTNRRSGWRGRLGASVLVTAVVAAGAVALVVHLQQTVATKPPGAAAPTARSAVTATSAPSPTTLASPTASPTPTVAPTAAPPPVDVAGAKQSALAMFVKIPRVLNDPSAGYVWSGGPSTSRHWTVQVKSRMAALQSVGYFGDTKCGEDYISHSQDALTSPPFVLSAVTGADGRVTVVIHRDALGGGVSPNLTAVMTNDGGTWLASDLESGAGPNASIFSATPNC